MSFLEDLNDGFEKLMQFREATGYATDTYRSSIPPFINYCGKNYPNARYITQEMIDSWLESYAYSTNSKATFISLLRIYTKFLCFMNREDFIPDNDYSTRRIPYNPHVFQASELTVLFNRLDSYIPHTCGIQFNPQLILPVYSRLLYCSGMRPQEPPALRRKDVDIDTGDIYIRQSKRHKDRHIIISEEMRLLCKQYDGLLGEREWFFQRPDGKPFGGDWFYHHFINAWKNTGLPGDPRPYDLRHSFASRNIINWLNAGRDVMQLLPYLSVYMGHSELTSTLYYVHLLPEELRKSVKIDWNQFAKIYEDVRK